MKYKTFLWTFLLSIFSGIVFFIFYLKAIFSVVRYSAYNDHPDPFSILEKLFTPPVIISFIILVAASLAYRIMAIVCVAKNKVARTTLFMARVLARRLLLGLAPLNL